MFELLVGMVIGAVLAVVSPPVFKYVAEKVTKIKAKIT